MARSPFNNTGRGGRPVRQDVYAHLPGSPFRQPDPKDKDKKDKGGKDKDKKNPANSYLEEAQTLAGQARALRAALGKKGFKAALKQQLDNVKLARDATDDILMQGFNERMGSLEAAASDNEKAAAGQSYANTVNASRERANALSEAMANGAGESDVLRAQQMSLRNWQANQSEVNRSYFDTLTSINSSRADLETDTASARAQNYLQAEADKNQLWSAYYDQRSETLTQLGNVQGERAQNLSLANDARGNRKTRRRQRRAQHASEEAFMDAAEVAGRAYETHDVPDRLQVHRPDFTSQLAAANAQAEVTDLGRPEGASLRKFPS